MRCRRVKIFINILLTNILVRNIVERKADIDRWKRVNDKILVYGRRKVGKSFFIKNFTQWDEFFFVKRDGGILDTRNFREISYDTLKDLILRNRDAIIVIDEFHRLGGDFLDFLHAYSDSLGKIRLITSTLWLSRKILAEDSPLLGIFKEFKMGLIDERDILRYTFKHLKDVEAVNAAVYLREPWLIPIFNSYESTINNMARVLVEHKNTIERLIREVFREEERELKKTYFAILSAIGMGKMKSSEISSILYSKKVIPKDDPSIIQSYIKTLISIGILKKITVINKKYDLLTHSSPILDLYFYLDGKYGFSEVDIPLQEVKAVMKERIPFHIEDFFRELLSKIHGLKVGKIIEKAYDVDIVLYSFKKVKMIGEVKWKRKIGVHETRRINEIMSKYDCEKFLITQDKKGILGDLDKDINVLDTSDLRKLIK